MAENTDTNEEIIDENIGAADEPEETPEIDSKYRLILLAAQRSKQLQRNATPRVNADPRKTKPTRIAMEEFKQGKVHFRLLEEEK